MTRNYFRDLCQISLSSGNFNVVRKSVKAHMVFVTDIAFSQDGKHVLSASADASARVTDITKASLKAATTEGTRAIPAWAR